MRVRKAASIAADVTSHGRLFLLPLLLSGCVLPLCCHLTTKLFTKTFRRITIYYLILKPYTKYKIDRDRNIAHNTDIQGKTEKNSAKSTRHMYHTVHETHIMSFISSRVNHPGSVNYYL